MIFLDIEGKNDDFDDGDENVYGAINDEMMEDGRLEDKNDVEDDWKEGSKGEVDVDGFKPQTDDSDDEFGEFQDGNYWMLGSDGGLSHNSDSDTEQPAPETTKTDENTTEALKYDTTDDNLKSDQIILTNEKVNKIKSAMGKLKLTPPTWAKAIPEEKWLNKLLYGGSEVQPKSVAK